MGARQQSLWVSRHEEEEPSRALATARPATYDLAVIGAGVVGATAALDAVRRGLSVVVIDAERDAALGVSGQATVKVTTGHAARAQQIDAVQGEQAALEYLRAAAAGMDAVRREAELISAAEPSTDEHVVYASQDSDVARLLRSAELAELAGLGPIERDPGSLPFPARAAVGYPDQLLIDPVAYVRGVLQAATALGCDVLLGAPVVGFDSGSPHEIATRRGPVRARDVIVATHIPVFNRTLAFAKVVQRRHFAVAGEVPGPVPTTIDISGRSMSTRPVAGDPAMAVVVGGAIDTGHDSTVESMHAVCAWAETHVGLRLTHTWSSQDAHPADELPLVGAVAVAPRMWIATGFAGWGFTLGTTAAMDLVRRIVGEEPVAPSWKPDRLGLVRGLGTIASIGAWTARGLVVDALALPGTDVVEAAASLSPGQGTVVRSGLQPQAVCVDRDGTVHIVGGRCTHLGCVIRWDMEAQSWECPCHGSRFAPDGSVLHGPATSALPPFGAQRRTG